MFGVLENHRKSEQFEYRTKEVSEKMKIEEHLYTAFQGFLVGAIVMAYVSNYNRSQLPIALLFAVIGILSRVGSKK
jgi:hypothetical protein